jgi:hypothetical protein
VFVVHGTRKFLQRVGDPTAAPDQRSTTSLGNWYATVLFWRPQVALFVNEATLLPILVPFAPAATVIDRFRTTVAATLVTHGLDHTFIDAELAQMAAHRLATTKNRSLIGMMNEFARLRRLYRDSEDVADLPELNMWLAHVPCGPLYTRHVTPADELAAIAHNTSPESAVGHSQ